MPRNGTGTYNLPAGQPVTSGTTISSSTHNTLMSDVANALTGSISADGQTPATANLPMGGYKHTNVAAATVRTEYPTSGQVQDGSLVALTSVGGSANVITATAAVSMAAYATGQRFCFVVGTTNSSATTLNINSIGAKTIKRDSVKDIVAGDLVAGSVADVFYDGTYFQLVNAYRQTFPCFSAYRSGTTQTVATGTSTIAQLNSEEFDSDACYDSATNYRFTASVAGYYKFEGQITGYASGSITALGATIRKNTTVLRIAAQNVNFNATSSSICVSAIIPLNAGDFVDLFGIVAGSGTLGFLLGQGVTFFQGHFVRPL